MRIFDLYTIYKQMKTVKIKDKDLHKIFESSFAELNGDRMLLPEEFTTQDKTEIKKIIKDFLKLNRSVDFEKEVEKVVSDKIKGNKELENKIVDITKNVIVQLYKAFWVKRNFWAGSLKNVSS